MVGKPLSLYERFKMGGNGSDKLIITDASNDIVELLKLTICLRYAHNKYINIF